MKQIALLLLVFFVCADAHAQNKSPVIEESFYVVASENREEFLAIYKTRLFPFWEEMRRMEIIKGKYRMFSQRLHTKDPVWTFKTVVRFTNYEAVDIWLRVRDRVFESLFPGEGGYKGVRKRVDVLHRNDRHWDEFIREIPLKD